MPEDPATDPLPALEFQPEFANYSRQVRIVALVVFAVLPPMMVYWGWGVLLGRPDWARDRALILLVEGTTVVLGLAMYWYSFRASDGIVTLQSDQVEIRYRRKAETMPVSDLIGMLSYYLLGDEVILLRGRGGRKIAFGPGLSETQCDEIRGWLNKLAGRNHIPIIPEANEKELKVLLKADDAFWLGLKRRDDESPIETDPG